jgi:ABC-2 type transport system permease protein
MTSTLFILGNEIHKGLRIAWYYKFNALTEFANHGFTFVGTLFLMNFGSLSSADVASALIGYIFYVYALEVLNSSNNFMLERKSGTLEQMYMSPQLPAVIFLGNILATVVWNSAMIAILCLIIMVLFKITLPLTLSAIPILLLTLGGLLGVGLAIAGVALVHKNITGFLNLTTNILFYINGAMLPIEHFPAWLQIIAHFLPVTQGIIVMRSIVLNGNTLAQTWADGSLGLLMVHTAIYFIAGWLVFTWCERKAKELGTIGQY